MAKNQSGKTKKAACVWGSVFMFSVLLLVGLSLGAVVKAQWKTGVEATGFSAVGTILEKNIKESPAGPKYQSRQYIYVKFQTDDKTTFVIPFRYLDIEAIPVHQDKTPEHQGTRSYYASSYCTSGNTCQNMDPMTETYVIPAKSEVVAHGILRYHLCQDWTYCFDSFTETPNPNSVVVNKK